MKKRLTFVIFLIVSMMIFVGCSSNSTNGDTDKNNNNTDNNDNEQQEDGYLFEVDSSLEGDITFWTWTPKIYEKVVESFNKEFPDINVDVVGLDIGELHDNLQTTLAAGSGSPDVSQVVEGDF